MHNDDLFIHRYTRADMLADGGLIEVPEPARARAGLRLHTAITRAVYFAVVWDTGAPTGKDTDPQRPFTLVEQIRLGRLLRAAVHELRSLHQSGNLDRRADRVTFTHGEDTFIFHIGPGDDGGPVFTIMTREDA